MPSANPLDKPYTNPEIPRTRHLSGRSYVAARMRVDGNGRLEKIATAVPALCGHTNRICTTCAPTWAIDYQLLLARTEGGRLLQAALPDLGNGPDAAETN